MPLAKVFVTNYVDYKFLEKDENTVHIDIEIAPLICLHKSLLIT